MDGRDARGFEIRESARVARAAGSKEAEEGAEAEAAAETEPETEAEMEGEAGLRDASGEGGVAPGEGSEASGAAAAAAPLTPLIFLDVDGVLHPLTPKHMPAEANYGDWLQRGDEAPRHATRVLSGEFVPRCMGVLKRLVERTGASLVLSSTWRESPQGVAAVNGQLALAGLAPIVGQTASLREARWRCTRAHEISAYLEEISAGRASASLQPDGARFVVLDDADLLGEVAPERGGGESEVRVAEVLGPHFVRTEMGTGLTEEDGERAVRILNGDYS